jgi:hypothetical protein
MLTAIVAVIGLLIASRAMTQTTWQRNAAATGLQPNTGITVYVSNDYEAHETMKDLYRYYDRRGFKCDSKTDDASLKLVTLTCRRRAEGLAEVHYFIGEFDKR